MTAKLFEVGPPYEDMFWSKVVPSRHVVCLCGSTRFKEDFERVMREETLQGHVVLSVGLFGHVEGLDMSGQVKKMLDELHLDKIRMADEVLVINRGGYVGESTGREVEFARSLGKPIRWMEDIGS